LGAAVHHQLHRILARLRLLQGDIEAGLAVIALVLGGVVAGELELVLPLELYRDLVGGGSGTTRYSFGVTRLKSCSM
jgi:hypothetical protein